MAKTIQEGFYKFKPADKWMRFSMNCWCNLKTDSEQSLIEFGKAYDSGDIIDQFIALSNVVYAALKAYDQDEGNEIDYTIYNVRTWLEQLQEEDTKDLVKAMTHSVNLGNKKGEK